MSSHSQATFFLYQLLLNFQTYYTKKNITRQSSLSVQLDVKCVDDLL